MSFAKRSGVQVRQREWVKGGGNGWLADSRNCLVMTLRMAEKHFAGREAGVR